MSEYEKDVHTEHCCIHHGCKYGDEDCPVTNGVKPQSYPCEYCDEAAIEYKMSGEAIYRAMYQHQGGKWEANETPEVWYETAKRYRRFLHSIKYPTPPKPL